VTPAAKFEPSVVPAVEPVSVDQIASVQPITRAKLVMTTNAAQPALTFESLADGDAAIQTADGQ
jgi:hypothetical protein